MRYINFAVNILKCGVSADDEHLEVVIVVSLTFASQYRHLTTFYNPRIYCARANHLFHCWSKC